MNEFSRSAALALLCGLLSATARADNGSRYQVTADNRPLLSLLNEYATALDGNPKFRARYPRERYMVIARGSGMLADDASGGYCSAEFLVYEYTFVNGILVMPISAVVKGEVKRNLRWGMGYLHEFSFMDGCAAAALRSLWN